MTAEQHPGFQIGSESERGSNQANELPGMMNDDAMTCSGGTDDCFIFFRHLHRSQTLWLELDGGLTSLPGSVKLSKTRP
jgi:hypothetical protein